MNIKLRQTGSNQATVEIHVDHTCYDFHFSYATCVGFKEPASTTILCENIWSKTTGRHLGELKNDRACMQVPALNFDYMLDAAFRALGKRIKEEQ